jgi:hypothetical protein
VFGVLATPWKETVRDAAEDIRACQEAAKVKQMSATVSRDFIASKPFPDIACCTV